MSRTPGLFPKCGCKVVGTSYPFQIVYCPLHAAAPELLEAAKAALGYIQRCGFCADQVERTEQLEKAIAHAEGQG